MSNLESIPLVAGDNVEGRVHLKLHHYPALDANSRRPVLLLHGASANHRTFTFPNGGLAEWLVGQGFYPWLLDWRASSLVVDDDANCQSLSKNALAYNFNAAAKHDIPCAIETIRAHHKDKRVAVLGFCMGGAILAEAVARRCITDEDVHSIVLMTLGLFYEPPIDGRLKCDDRVLEFIAAGKKTVSIDPRVDEDAAKWPKDLNGFYDKWPGALKWHPDQPPDRVKRMCNRVSFVYGLPYHHGNLPSKIHELNDNQAPWLDDLFGGIPLHMLIHGTRNIRRRHATYYQPEKDECDEALVSDDARAMFHGFDQVTLITGELNRLWHRDSIDRMYEWLTRGDPTMLKKIRKHVLSGYGHQDLLWGACAREKVFEKFLLEALSQGPPASSSIASPQRLASQGIPNRTALASPRR